jgi:hypothetical protein
MRYLVKYIVADIVASLVVVIDDVDVNNDIDAYIAKLCKGLSFIYFLK